MTDEADDLDFSINPTADEPQGAPDTPPPARIAAGIRPVRTSVPARTRIRARRGAHAATRTRAHCGPRC